MVKATKNKAAYGPYTVVIKLGTSSIIHETTHQPLLSILSSIVETVIRLRSQGHKVVLVSSGAIGVGMKRMELPARPKGLAAVQALAAIGQGRLIALWDNLFSQLGQPIAQVLLTRGDLSDRTRYLNAVNTFGELLSMGVVPIVNENDTVSVSEIRFGDNDSLSAVTASMIHADFLFLLTDVDGLYTSNPRKDPDARFIEVVESVMEIRKQVSTATLGSKLGTGGMETKLIAAEIASAGGVSTIICKSSNPANVFDIIEHISANKVAALLAHPVPTGISTPSSVMNSDSEDSSRSISSSQITIAPTVTAAPGSSTSGLSHSNRSEARPLYTLFKPSVQPLRDVKSWTTYALAPSGSVIIDAGAHAVLSRRESGGRLLAVGVVGVAGKFAPGQAVRILVRRHLERKDHHQLVLGHQQKGSMGLPPFKEVADSQGASPATPSSPSLSPAGGSTIESISTMELLSRTASHGSLDAEAADVEATPMVSKLTLEPDAHDYNESLVGQPPSRKVTGESSGSGDKTHVHADVKPEDEWIDVEVGRGLANYNSADIAKAMGMKSTNMVKVLGYADSEYVVENITIRLAP